VAPEELRVTTLVPELDGAVGGVAVDALGFVYVADFGETVWKISPWGEVEILADTLYGASGNAVAADGDLLQASFNAGTVSRIARDGSVETLVRDLAGPVGVAVDDAGGFYVCLCRGNAIAHVSAAGEVREVASGELFSCPNGITRDADGILHVVNFNDGRMLRVTPEGEASLFATLPGGLGHVAFDGADFYVTGFRTNRLYRVSAAGEVTPVAGTGAFAVDDGAGPEATFSSPNGIAYDATRDVLYVNDHRIPWSRRFLRRDRPVSALRRIAFPTLYEAIDGAFASGGAAAVGPRIRAHAARRPNQPYEPILNGYAYRLLQDGEVAAAVAVFEANRDLFPESANVWDSLGEAYAAAGRRDDAVAAYRRSLELDPGNDNARTQLDEPAAD
jgi:sugar lactone lactonase YvrE